MGSPPFAATILQALLQHEGVEVVGVFTQPDRPAGRGRKPRPPAVKQLALVRDLPVCQPLSLKKDPSALDTPRALEPDVIVVAAYGLLLPKEALELPRLGCVNVHASLLPKYRGAAPIQRAIMAGEPVTRVTIMQMSEGMAEGDILRQRALGIGVDDTAEDIHDQLAEMGSALLLEALDLAREGKLVGLPQDHGRATYAPKLAKDEGLVDWNRPARQVHNQIRALHPWPGAHFFWTGMDPNEPMRLKIAPGRVGPPSETPCPPGTIVGMVDGFLAIACADSYYLTPAVTPEGKSAVDALSFCNGYLQRCAAKL